MLSLYLHGAIMSFKTPILRVKNKFCSCFNWQHYCKFYEPLFDLYVIGPLLVRGESRESHIANLTHIWLLVALASPRDRPRAALNMCLTRIRTLSEFDCHFYPILCVFLFCFVLFLFLLFYLIHAVTNTQWHSWLRKVFKTTFRREMFKSLHFKFEKTIFHPAEIMWNLKRAVTCGGYIYNKRKICRIWFFSE